MRKPRRHVPALSSSLAADEQAAALFDELREVLRLNSSPEHLLRGRAPSETQEEIKAIPKRLKRWQTRLQRRMSRESDADRRHDQQTVLGYLKTYKDQWVGHVIALKGHSEPLVVSRTNNVSEHRFGKTKRALRRKVGTKKLTRYIQAMRPEVPHRFYRTAPGEDPGQRPGQNDPVGPIVSPSVHRHSQPPQHVAATRGQQFARSVARHGVLRP